MCDVDFISEYEYQVKYESILDVFFPSPKYSMFYDESIRKIRIRNLVGRSALEVYQLLCHEILHAVLHRVENLEVCKALDNISNVVDGGYAYIWMGEDWQETEL